MSNEGGSRAAMACVLEASARKPGNVHRFADFEDCTYLDFMLSAAVIGRFLTPEGVRRRGVGGVVFDAVDETVRVVGRNTNLGMVLLLAPLTGVEAADGPGVPGIGHASEALRSGASRIVEGTTVEDARAVYGAIRRARPGGLGSAPEQDVAGEPTVTLVEAMRLAAGRDAIARQYATGYEDVFELGLPTLRGAIRDGRPLEAAIVLVHLTLMARRPDTLIARKRGPGIAEESARRAAAVLEAGWPDRPGSVAAIRDLDVWLRDDGHTRNPGATADLVAAVLFAALWDATIELPGPFRGPDWDAGGSLP